MVFDAAGDYPLGTRRPDLVRTPGGLALAELTLDALRAGSLDASEMRATAETLRLQGEVARAAGRSELAANLDRAAELTAVPDEVILEIYTGLRPHRSTSVGARLNAAFVREAKEVYSRRNLLGSDERAAQV
ncbi:MAG: glycerol dehydrogenase [Actinobacteria bacterium]|nr:MAG: glycerol dehydrogenase [Actinomycetota bacterium]